MLALASMLHVADYSPTSWSNGFVVKRGIAGESTATDSSPLPGDIYSLFPLISRGRNA